MVKIKNVFLILFVMLISACSQSSSVLNYYRLSAAQTTKKTYQLPINTLGIGPVTLSAYLSRQGVVTHKGLNQLTYAANNRWAEPLSDNLTQVLQDNFKGLLPKVKVLLYPWQRGILPDYQLLISIKKFGYVDNGQVILDVSWQVNDPENISLLNGNDSLQKKTADHGYLAAVSAQSELLAQLSEQIARKLAEQTSSRPSN